MSSLLPDIFGSQDIQQFVDELVKLAGPKGPSMHTGFTTSFLAILVSQIGDKTFFLAMIMATRYSQLMVFLGAFGALFLMTLISTGFGKIATAWISPLFTNIIVTVLFLYFGIKMLLDAKNHQQTQQNEQKKQVQQQLQVMENKFVQRHSHSQQLLQKNEMIQQQSVPQKPVALPKSQVLYQAFLLTFLAEWGDRSQIATIALAASFNPFIVTLGALLGYLICTTSAVKIGEWISGKITEKQILIIGGIVFVISGICTGAIALDHWLDGQP